MIEMSGIYGRKISQISIFFSMAMVAASLAGCSVYERPTHTMLWNIQSINSIHDDMNTLPPIRLEVATELVYSSDQLSKGANFSITRATLKGGGVISTENFVEIATPVAPRDLNFGVAKKSDDSTPFMALCDSAYDDRGPLLLYEGTRTEPDMSDTVAADSRNPESQYYFYFFDSNRPSTEGGSDVDRDIYWFNTRNDPSGPREVGFNSPADDAYPTVIGGTGRIMFSSNRPGGQGGWDLWLTDPVAGAASVGDVAGTAGLASTNMATEARQINSPYDEMCPYFLPCSLGRGILVFVSNRHSQGSDFDLYFSIFEDGAWTVPKRLEAPAVEFSPGVHKDGKNQDCLVESGWSADGTVWYATDGVRHWLNSSANEFRPVLVRPSEASGGSSQGLWMIYSSDRVTAHSAGGYDLYLAWLDADDIPSIGIANQ